MTDRKNTPEKPPLKKGPARTKSMTAAEFAAVEPLLNISAERIKAARFSLVDNLSYEAAANAIGLGWSRQAVGDCVRVVWKEFEKYQKSRAISSSNTAVPAGWEQVTLTAPSELVPQLYALIAAHSAGKSVTPVKAKKAPAAKTKKAATVRAEKEA